MSVIKKIYIKAIFQAFFRPKSGWSRQKLKNRVKNVLSTFDFICFNTRVPYVFTFKRSFQAWSRQNVKIVSETSFPHIISYVLTPTCLYFKRNISGHFQAVFRPKSAWSRQNFKIMSETSFPHMIPYVLTPICLYFQKKYFRPKWPEVGKTSK